jgi:very-short-patch-repair endonuclease
MGESSTSRTVWELVARQHGVITRRQLRGLGLSAKAIDHRVRTGRLRVLWRGVYCVGRPALTQRGWWMAAVLACGPGALLSHRSAAALWGMRAAPPGPIEVSIPRPGDARRRGIRVHRRRNLRSADVAAAAGIPVSSPTCTLVDIAPTLGRGALEAAVTEADKLDLVHVADLRRQLDSMPRRAGVRVLRTLLDEQTFTLTDSELERRFIPIARRAGLPMPVTQARVNGYRIDFYWPELELVVETDGLRYHRTPAQQKRDRLRDQAHTAAGLATLRFTHDQVAHDPDYVEQTLARTATARDRAVPPGRGARMRRRWPRGRVGSA